jgi:radical SAM superfamily enzyme YgiQ (UPF0313 family)
MDLLLINPFPAGAEGINEATIEPPLGLAYLAAYARDRGFEVDLIDANALRIPPEDLLEHVLAVRPRVLGVSSNLITHLAGVTLLRGLSARGFSGYTLLGGPFPSSEPEYCLRSAPVDAVVVGEGEETLAEIMEKISRGDSSPAEKTKGCVWRAPGGEIRREEPRPLIPDLDALPMPAWDLLPPFRLYKSRARRRPIGALITSRGCPHQCTYCNKSIFGARSRFHSVDRVIAEVDILVETYGIRQLDFLDDNLTLKLVWAKDLFRRLRPYGLAINLQNGIRADFCDEELLDVMRAAGVFKISFGVESGSPEGQRRIKKNLDLSAVLRAARWARERGIVVYANFILGLPYETTSEMHETIDFAIRMDPDIATFNCLLPLPGTEVWREIAAHGRFFFGLDNLLALGFYGSAARYWLPGMNPEDVTVCYREAYRRFYLRPAKILQLIRKAVSPGELRWLWETAWGVLHLPRLGSPRLPGSARGRIVMKSAPGHARIFKSG